jgi:hypothetical protein
MEYASKQMPLANKYITLANSHHGQQQSTIERWLELTRKKSRLTVKNKANSSTDQITGIVTILTMDKLHKNPKQASKAS